MSVITHGLQRFWLAVGVWGLLASVAYAATDEQLKAQLVKVLSEAGLKMTGAVNEKFCRQFFKDFMAQDKITYVKPLVQVETYNDPALASYKAKCPKLTYFHRDETDDSPQQELELNETTSGQFGTAWQGTANFRLYKGNFNNDATDGDEFVFYYDQLVPQPVNPLELAVPGSESSGDYRVVDFEHCEILDTAHVDMARQFERNEAKRPGYNGLIKYQGRFYLFDLYPVDRYSMALWEFTNRERKFESICAYN